MVRLASLSLVAVRSAVAEASFGVASLSGTAASVGGAVPASTAGVSDAGGGTGVCTNGAGAAGKESKKKAAATKSPKKKVAAKE